MISIFETMKAYSLDDGLTEEALVTKLRTRRCHHLFLHASLRHNASGFVYNLYIVLAPLNCEDNAKCGQCAILTSHEHKYAQVAAYDLAVYLKCQETVRSKILFMIFQLN